MNINTLPKEGIEREAGSMPSVYERISRQNAQFFYDKITQYIVETRDETRSIEKTVVRIKAGQLPTRIKEKEVGWWLGTVKEVHDDSFSAILEDLSGNTNIVEFEKEIIDPKETDLLFIGSTFTYSISLIDKPTGREYITKLAFSARRKWLREYEEKAKQVAEEIFPENLLNL